MTSLLAIMVIFFADILTPSDIRLHVLYVFPLAAIAIHCEHVVRTAAGALLSILCQLFTFHEHGLSAGSMATDLSVMLASMLLIIVLGRSVRASYLKLARLAERDPLTGLLNRRGFDSRADGEIARQARHGGVFSVIVLDLDGFKQLNDSLGHQGGDHALKVVADAIAGITRGSDIVGRLGGDEFVVLMPHTSAESGAKVCATLADDIAEKTMQAGCPTTASIGFVAFDRSPGSVSRALELADHAMYINKSERRMCRAPTYGAVERAAAVPSAPGP
ncbi:MULTISPECIES: GGDEF domain-containing protein [unclassified Duganella]|uniref:GGDEF domain-containing protein n=1 Tax=unclassified Duganella TaxID=2636909 RepID=UPI00131456B4|nr:MULTISPECIES: GGDEF domain-containing protein [unclassified Duganella]